MGFLSNRQPGIEEANTGIGSLRVPQGVGRRMGRKERPFVDQGAGRRMMDQGAGRQKYKDYSSRGMQAMPMQSFNRGNPHLGIEGLLMSEADSYSPQNLIQMLQDARDADNQDEVDMLYNDLEMRFPTLADVDDDNTAVQSLFGQGYSMEEIMDIMAARPMSV
tara:strand:+ start:29 stop:517 length:489 start_codon:yes stop_codon:yes gene_type:complete